MTSLLKQAIQQIVPGRVLGAIDYIRFPKRSPAWGGAFNGQPVRQALFSEIIAKIRPRALFETGTYLGTTTDFLAKTGLPVYTIELNPRNYGFVCARFSLRRNVNAIQGDSRDVLRRLVNGSLRNAEGPLFFYLDAHWGDDLPLADELEIVFSRCSRAVVMIDDFQVPFDSGYGYDDYGNEKILNQKYIEPVISAYNLGVFYPSTSSSAEGGALRGCAVLANDPAHIAALSTLSLLCAKEAS